MKTPMRQIKFRAWDVSRNEWCYQNDTAILCDSRLLHNDGDSPMRYEPNKSLDKRIVLQQFTGLKDKNGKEIYEGDILSPNNREVIWRDDGSYDNGVGFYTLCHNPEYPKIPFTFGKTQAEDSEVIGNIYENPELINQNENTKG